MDSRDSLDQTLGSIDLTKSPVKHTSTQRHIEKINEDTSNNDTDEMITFDKQKTKTTYRKDINALRKRAKTVKTKTALKADHKANRAPNDTQNSANTNDELINGANADTIIHVDNIDNIEIVAENVTNAATNAGNLDTDSINADNVVNAEIENEKSEEAVMSDDNTENAVISNNNIDDAALGDDNTENVTMDPTDPTKVKTSKKHIPIWVKPSEPPKADLSADEIATL